MVRHTVAMVLVAVGQLWLPAMKASLADVKSGSTPTERTYSEEFSYLLAGLVSERELLKSGIAHIDFSTGELQRRDTLYPATSKRVVYAFNTTEGKVRVEAREGDAKTIYIRTPQFGVSASFRGSEVEGGVILKKPPNEPPLPRYGFFDIRCVGLLTSTQMFDPRYASLNLNQIVDVIKRPEVAAIALNGDGSHDVTTRIAEAGIEMLHRIDPDRGYVPLKLEVRMVPPKKRKTLHSIDITWKQVNGVWLPDKFIDQGLNGTKSTMSFQWSHVNERVPEELFSVDNLLPSDTTFAMFVDRRVEPALIEKVVGAATPSKLENSESSWWRFLLISVNLLFVAALVALIFWRRRSMST